MPTPNPAKRQRRQTSIEKQVHCTKKIISILPNTFFAQVCCIRNLVKTKKRLKFSVSSKTNTSPASREGILINTWLDWELSVIDRTRQNLLWQSLPTVL